MSVIAVLGCQWGDEGKGKIVDLLGSRSRVVVRCNGGPNAGHTIVNSAGTFKMRLIPSGIFHPRAICLIGNGVVIDPATLLEEMDMLAGAGLDLSRLLISDRAHVIMPYHRMLDELEEKDRADAGPGFAIGTTKRGIGPAYVDKTARVGIRMADLQHEETLLSKLTAVLNYKNRILTKLYDAPPVSLHDTYLQLVDYGRRLGKHIISSDLVLSRALGEKHHILLEGAQGAMLDLDIGSYPYVTSSNPTAGGCCVGAGLPPTALDGAIGVYKAYQTRVGEGPFPSELHGAEADFLRNQGGAGHGEFGTVTGRPRRVGWFDAVAARYIARANGLTALAITRLDALDQMPMIRICTGYQMNDMLLRSVPAEIATMEMVQPVYEDHPGWMAPTTGATRWDDLPQNARKYLSRLRELIGVRIDIVSVGPDRDQTILLREPFDALPDIVSRFVDTVADRGAGL
ncbi:MAG TPA: adenylosuccinate synthase [Chloroflexia bacterium]|nr:adenylosuccinate synthase [Chloroflexia bacterium]